MKEIERRVEEQGKREEEEAKATKAFTQREAELLRKQLEEVKKKAELKRSRPESEMEAKLEKEEEKSRESVMMDRDMVWKTKAGKICRECQRGGQEVVTLSHTLLGSPQGVPK